MNCLELSTDIRLALQQRGITFSRSESAKIVGSKQRLQRLIDQGYIRAIKPNVDAQNGRWCCPADQVLLFARPRREKTYWERRGIKPPKRDEIA